MESLFQRSTRILALATALTALAAATPRLVRACSCGTTTWPGWPAAGATDVPLRTPIVVMRAKWPQVQAPAYLEAPDGTTIPLEMENVLVGAYSCVVPEFLKAAQPLSPLTTYILKFDLSQVPTDLPYPAPDYRTISFTTGEQEEEPEVAAVDVETYRAANPVECAKNPDIACSAFMEAKVSVASLSGPPTWVRLSSGGETVVSSLAGAPFGYDPNEPPPQVDFVTLIIPLATSEDECVDYERIDAHGNVIEAHEICGFRKCIEATTRTFFCGLPKYQKFGADLWDRVSDESCSAPPTVWWNFDTNDWGILEQTPPGDEGSKADAGTKGQDGPTETGSGGVASAEGDDGSASSTSGACSVQRVGGTSSCAWLGLLPLALLCCVRWRLRL